jgi:hypothetical protein
VDDTAVGEVGIPAIQKVRGFETPNITPYNQVPGMWIPQAELMNIITGMYKDLYPRDPYDMDETWQPLREGS